MRLRDVVFFVAEDWSRFSQRSQSLAIEFSSRGHRVFYIQPILSFGALLGGLRHKNALNKTFEIPGVTVLKPIFSLISFRGGESWWIDQYFFKLWFFYVKQARKIEMDAVVIINLPYWWKWAVDRSDFPSGTVIYDCIDDIRVYARNEKVERDISAVEIQLVKDADFVLTTAIALKKHIIDMGNAKCVEMVTNGVDVRKFVMKESHKLECFGDIAKPVFGFVGALYHWIDFKVFEILASKFKGASIVLVGPTNRAEEISVLCRNFTNVIYLGPIDYCDVPSYMAAFDVCLNPFVVDRLGDSVNPLKLYEYLAMGKPVICSATEELRQYSKLVYLFADYDELVSVAQLAIAEDDSSKAVSRTTFAMQHAWSAKVDAILELLEKNEFLHN